MNIEEEGKTYIKIKDRQEKSIIERNKVLEKLSKLEPLENEEYPIEEELEEVMKENLRAENRMLKEQLEIIVNENKQLKEERDKLLSHVVGMNYNTEKALELTKKINDNYSNLKKGDKE